MGGGPRRASGPTVADVEAQDLEAAEGDRGPALRPVVPGRPVPRDPRAAGVVQFAAVDHTGAARPLAPDVRIGVDPDRALRSGRVRVAHLFSGPRREGDVQQALELEAGRRGLGLDVLSVDILYGDVCDLTDPVRLAQWRSWCRDGTVSAVIGGPPCESWSRARAREGGPAFLRGSTTSGGCPFSTERRPARSRRRTPS